MSFTCVLVFILLVFSIVFVQNDVNVTDSGVIPWKEGDFAIQFYVTLNNYGNRPVTVVADMIKCWEHISETDIDTDHFQLIGNTIDLEARRTKNVTLTYLNIYSYNRRGKCDIRMNITSNSIQHLESTVFRQISFDTISMRQYLFRGPSKLQCKFPDEDPFDSCLPVNCHMKYSGYRGFYSISEKKCIKIPICQSNNKSKQAYLWSNNQCVDLNNIVTQNDIHEVLHMIENNASDEMCQTIDYIPSSQKIRCHRGRLNNYTDLCECDSEWENVKDFNWEDFIPSTVPFYMCTVRKIQIPENCIDSLKDTIIREDWTVKELINSFILSCIFVLISSWFCYIVIIIH